MKKSFFTRVLAYIYFFCQIIFIISLLLICILASVLYRANPQAYGGLRVLAWIPCILALVGVVVLICCGRNPSFHKQLDDMKFTLTEPMLISVKIAIIVGISLLILSVVSLFFFEFEGIGYVIFSACLLSGIIFGAYVYLFFLMFEDRNKLLNKNARADKYRLNCSTFAEFSCQMQMLAESNGYRQIASKELENYCLTLYLSKKVKGVLRLILVVKTDEATDEKMEESVDDYIKCIEEYYKKSIKEIAPRLSIITFLCVDRITYTFQRLVNLPPEQDFDVSRLIAGVSFGGKGVYLAKPANIFAYFKYKQLYRHFIKMFGEVLLGLSNGE